MDLSPVDGATRRRRLTPPSPPVSAAHKPAASSAEPRVKAAAAIPPSFTPAPWTIAAGGGVVHGVVRRAASVCTPSEYHQRCTAWSREPPATANVPEAAFHTVVTFLAIPPALATALSLAWWLMPPPPSPPRTPTLSPDLELTAEEVSCVRVRVCGGWVGGGGVGLGGGGARAKGG